MKRRKTSFKDLKESVGLGWAIFAIALVVVLVLGLCFGLMCLEALFVMLLWNAIIPSIIVVALPITFWKAFGLSLLISLLFGGSRLANDITNSFKDD